MSERRIEKRSGIGQVISTVADLEARVITYRIHGLASSESTTNVAVLAAKSKSQKRVLYYLVLACSMERREGGPWLLRGLGAEFRRSGTPPKINHWSARTIY